MLKNKKGFGSPTLYAVIALLVVSAISFFWIKGLMSDVRYWKAESKRFEGERDAVTLTLATQIDADMAALTKCQNDEGECLNRLAQCFEQPIIAGCPTITKITNKKNKTVIEVEAAGWEVR